jgi:hypothetical protein
MLRNLVCTLVQVYLDCLDLPTNSHQLIDHCCNSTKMNLNKTCDKLFFLLFLETSMHLSFLVDFQKNIEAKQNETVKLGFYELSGTMEICLLQL